MRADALRALAAQYRRLEKAYPAGGYDKSAQDCERMAVRLEAQWAAEDETPLGQAHDGGGEDGL